MAMKINFLKVVNWREGYGTVLRQVKIQQIKESEEGTGSNEQIL